MKFAANLGFLFVENGKEVLKQCHLAKDAGFDAVEIPNPYNESISELKNILGSLKLEVVLINSCSGGSNDFGMACLPDRIDEFKDSLETALKYALELKCDKIHVLASKVDAKSGISSSEYEEVYVKNLTYACERLSREKVTCLIEPINNVSLPNYFLNNYELAFEIIKRVNCSNLKLLLDIFHAQMLHGNLTKLLEDCLPFLGHLQVAQVPDRGGPYSEGEVNYDYVFKKLQSVGYNGWVGLEYFRGNDNFEWINKFKF